MDQPSRHRRGLPLDLCGPYVGDDIDVRDAHCYLSIGRSEVAIDIPLALLRKHRASGGGDVVLRVCGEPSVSVSVVPMLTESQRKAAIGWSTEMQDFDRF